MCERIKNLFTGILGDQSNPFVESESPSHLIEPISPLARVDEKIAEYLNGFDEDGHAEWCTSFGTLLPEEQAAIIDRFATDEGRVKTGRHSVTYSTNLVDAQGNKLYLHAIGNYGVQIDNRGFD